MSIETFNRADFQLIMNREHARKLGETAVGWIRERGFVDQPEQESLLAGVQEVVIKEPARHSLDVIISTMSFASQIKEIQTVLPKTKNEDIAVLHRIGVATYGLMAASSILGESNDQVREYARSTIQLRRPAVEWGKMNMYTEQFEGLFFRGKISPYIALVFINAVVGLRGK